jgi:hypothetical protein
LKLISTKLNFYGRCNISYHHAGQAGQSSKGQQALQVYQCRLIDGRRRKCFRANLFKIAEENLAFARPATADGLPDGIFADGFDVVIRLVFKEEAWMLKFQSALLVQVATTTGNKRPRYISDKARAGTNGDDEEDHENDLDVPIDDEALSVAPFHPSQPLRRIFRYDYNHANEEGSVNSPECNTFSDARSMSIFSGEPETVTIREAETRAQMLEAYTHEFFHGKNAEVAHIKNKAKCTVTEEKDINNRLHLSRHLHEAFDGINTEPKHFPWFLVHYVRHDAEKVDCPRIGNDAVIAFPFKKRHRTIVHVQFYHDQSAADYAKYLKVGSRRVDALTYEVELYFEDAEKAKKYLDWKEENTRNMWSSNAG